jgi:hypothetical protein
MNPNPKHLIPIGAALALVACGANDDTTPPTGGGGTGSLPRQVRCEGDVCRLSAAIDDPITQDLTLTADKRWLLQGGVFVGDEASETVLRVEAGTTVYGETSSKAFLVIRRGSKILAEGTAAAPIVFTSSKEAGSRARGDWGGLVVNGRARVNGCDTGVCEPEGEGGTGRYGGADDADSSGVLRYVRVEFAGNPITPDNELNGIAFQGVGSGTTIDHVQVHMAADDGVEFFGGTASFKHVLITGVADDALDWTDGWRGKGQFVVVQQYEDAGDNGIEADNNGDANAAEPRSAPSLANLTLIGVPSAPSSDVGMLLREGTGAHIHAAIVSGWNEACLDIDHAETFRNAVQGGVPTGRLVVAASIFSCATPFQQDDEKDAMDQPIADPFSVEDFVTSMNAGNRMMDPMMVAPFDTAAPDFRPMAGSPAMQGATRPDDPFFTAVDYIGGVDPSMDPARDWTRGWTTHARD